MYVELVPFLIIFTIIGLPIICITLVKLAKILRGRDEKPGGRKRGPTSELDESQLIQEIHRGLSRLETRIDSLETIVYTSDNKKSSPTSHE